MTKTITRLLIALVCYASTCCGYEGLDPYYDSDLLRDLAIVDCVNARLCRKVPVTYNLTNQAGLLQMPSARVGPEGVFGVSYSDVPPYRNTNMRFQLTDRVELSAAYRVFDGIPDPVLTAHGFGDFSDKGANVKFALFLPEDSDYLLPGIAFGLDDFTGTRGFEAEHVTVTQVFPKYGLEATFGYGTKRIDGFFGGVNWTPFYRDDCWWTRGLTLTAEWDAIDYEDPTREPHPQGRERSTHLNAGVKWRLWDVVDLSVARVRGKEFAWSAGINTDFGNLKGLTKVDDKLPYHAPRNTEPIGFRRSEEILVQEYLWALDEQGISLMDAWIGCDPCRGKILRLVVTHSKYRDACELYERLREVATYLAPSNFDEILFVIETQGLPVQEYHFPVEYLRRYRQGRMGEYELDLLSPMCEASIPYCDENTLYRRGRDLYSPYLHPSFRTLLGSSRGKVKYWAGMLFGSDGFLPGDVVYSVRGSVRLASEVEELGDMDMINPSQIVNVRSDGIRYMQGERFKLPQLFLQKHWNLGCGWYARTAVGHFEIAYGGVAGEVLYYPVGSCWAVGLEAAYLGKRKYSGIGFQKRLRKLNGFQPSYVHHELWQAFVDLYLEWPDTGFDTKISAGHFLADDWGARVEVGRTFCSGFRAYMWYTRTNGDDAINGERYHDRGIGFSMPMDHFYTRRTNRRWGYNLSAWLRDVGARAATGHRLHELIHNQR